MKERKKHCIEKKRPRQQKSAAKWERGSAPLKCQVLVQKNIKQISCKKQLHKLYMVKQNKHMQKTLSINTYKTLH